LENAFGRITLLSSKQDIEKVITRTSLLLYSTSIKEVGSYLDFEKKNKKRNKS